MSMEEAFRAGWDAALRATLDAKSTKSAKGPMDIVREEGLKLGLVLDDASVEYILWEETGFPSFWDIPKDGATPEECLRTQARQALEKVKKTG